MVPRVAVPALPRRCAPQSDRGLDACIAGLKHWPVIRAAKGLYRTFAACVAKHPANAELIKDAFQLLHKIVLAGACALRVALACRAMATYHAP